MQRNEQREIWSCNFYSIFFFLLFYFDLAISSQSFNLRLWFSTLNSLVGVRRFTPVVASLLQRAGSRRTGFSSCGAQA